MGHVIPPNRQNPYYVPARQGFRNTYTGIIQRPCYRCHEIARALYGYPDDAPISNSCTCRLLRPPRHILSPEQRIYMPRTTRGIYHGEIGTNYTRIWTRLDWITMVIEPIHRLQRYPDGAGPQLQFIQYLLHMSKVTPIPNATWQLLTNIGIGPTIYHLRLFIQWDLPAAMKCCPPPHSDVSNRPVVREVDERNQRICRDSCIFNIVLPAP